MESEQSEDMNEGGRQFNVENKAPNVVDFKWLMELTNDSDKGNWQLANLVKNWENKQANAVRLLREELHNLRKPQREAEVILEERQFDVVFQDREAKIEPEYWKQRAQDLEKLLEASVGREQVLMVKLEEESIQNLEKQWPPVPVKELKQLLDREDNFLHFVLQNAPLVIGHQDKDLRYRFIFNHFPSLRKEDIIGKTDVEIFTGAGVRESQDFKKEVLERGLPAKREITFETELFGSKTFLFYVEPVFSKDGDTVGVNYIGMEVTDQVRKREKMAKLREEMAVQKAKETELNKTILDLGVVKLETTSGDAEIDFDATRV